MSRLSDFQKDDDRGKEFWQGFPGDPIHGGTSGTTYSIAHICDANHLIPICGPLSTEEELLPQNKHDINRPNRIPMETYGLDI